MPARLTMPIAALASVWRIARVVKPKSSSSVMTPSAYEATFVRAYSSASALDKATIACVLAQLLKQ